MANIVRIDTSRMLMNKTKAILEKLDKKFILENTSVHETLLAQLFNSFKSLVSPKTWGYYSTRRTL